jgi:hypothetical protein
MSRSTSPTKNLRQLRWRAALYEIDEFVPREEIDELYNIRAILHRP